MRPSLRFVSVLAGAAAVVGVTSVVVLEHQQNDRLNVEAEQLTSGKVDGGKQALQRYGCGGCHRIRGVDGADGEVGPSLTGIAVRTEIAGRLVNRPDNMILWIRHPQQVDPGNGMPDLGVTEQDARDMAAYLYALRPNP